MKSQQDIKITLSLPGNPYIPISSASTPPAAPGVGAIYVCKMRISTSGLPSTAGGPKRDRSVDPASRAAPMEVCTACAAIRRAANVIWAGRRRTPRGLRASCWEDLSSGGRGWWPHRKILNGYRSRSTVTIHARPPTSAGRTACRPHGDGGAYNAQPSR